MCSYCLKVKHNKSSVPWRTVGLSVVEFFGKIAACIVQLWVQSTDKAVWWILLFENQLEKKYKDRATSISVITCFEKSSNSLAHGFFCHIAPVEENYRWDHKDRLPKKGIIYFHWFTEGRSCQNKHLSDGSTMLYWKWEMYSFSPHILAVCFGMKKVRLMQPQFALLPTKGTQGAWVSLAAKLQIIHQDQGFIV